MLKIGMLASGGLGLDTLTKIENDYSLEFVLTDRNSIDISKWAKSKGVPCYSGNPRKGLGYHFIKNIKVDVICSVNYLFLIDADIITHAKILTFNIHGSLLPKYRGRTPHVWSIINNESYTGITAHIIDQSCDTGDIIEQITIPIEKDDTGGSLLEKYKLKYYPLISSVIENIEQNNLKTTKQDNSLATYYHKRTPEDGKINWDWEKERIKNWVRALSSPYPGAFTFHKGGKMIIDKIEFSNLGYDSNIENGTILSNKKELIVKTSNGAISIVNKRDKVLLEVGEVLK